MERKLAAILMADIVEYSRHVHEAEESALLVLRDYRAVIGKLINNHRGRIFDTAGDSVLAEFNSPVEAVRCATEVQQAIANENANLAEPRRMLFRIGIHLGDVAIEEGKLKGEGVNIAARLEALANPGGIFISGDIQHQVHHILKLGFDDLGERRLKNIAEPIRVYRVRATPLPWWRQQLANQLKRRGAYVAASVLASFAFFALASIYVERLPESWRNAVGMKSGVRVAQASIAVLALRNTSGNTNEEYFSDGLTQDITGELARFRNLFVIASNSAFTYKGKPTKVQEIGRDLGVAYILEGTVQREQGRVRLSAQLVDTGTGRQVWGERYDRGGNDLFDIQDSIIQAVVTRLAVEVDAAEVKKIGSNKTNNASAYDHYLKGRQLFYIYTPDSNKAAKVEFAETIRLDANFARAYGWLGYTYLVDIQEGWTDNGERSAALALELATKGVDLGPEDYYTHWNLASIYAGRKDMERALKEYSTALALNSNDADLLAEMADLFSYQGEADRAVEQIERAKRLNPKYPYWYEWSLGFAYFQKRQYAEAVAALKKMSDPPNTAYLLLVASQAKLGNPTPLDQVMARLRSKDPNWTPDHLNQFPFVKTEDQQHYLDSFRAIGISVPKE